jgi:uncharacterized protein YlxW (UPF0749 family)
MTEPARSEDLLTELFRNPLDPGYAEAARRRAGRTSEPPRWQRAGSRGALLVVLVLTGLLFAVAYRAVARAEPATGQARADLVGDVRARRAETDELQRQADALRREVARDRDDSLAGAGADQLRELAAAGGLGAVSGPGVVVRLADAPAAVDPVTGRQVTDNPGIVVDRDLQDIANALWQAGAEAVTINGERLTATTTIRAAGGAILVDLRPVSNPYEVAAIGPPDLEKSFDEAATAKRFRRYVSTYRMEFSVQRRSTVNLAAAAQPRLRFVRPSGEPSGSPGIGTSPAVGASSARTPATPVPSRSGGGR